MKPGRLTFPAPPLAADAGPTGWPPSSAVLPSLIDLLMGLSDWPKDHGIRVRSTDRRSSLSYCRVATSRRVIEILFDPATGRYECTNCQSADFDLPTSVQGEPDGGFIRAVVRGLTAAAAMAVLQGAMALLELWSQDMPSVDAPRLALDDDGDDGIAEPSAAGRAIRRKPAV